MMFWLQRDHRSAVPPAADIPPVEPGDVAAPAPGGTKLDRCWWPTNMDVRPGRIVTVGHLHQISDEDWRRMAEDRPPRWLVERVKRLFKERT